VLDYLRNKRDGLLETANGTSVKLKCTPHNVSKYAGRMKLHNRPFAKPVQYQFLKQLDFLVDEPWLCAAERADIDVDLTNGVSKICYVFSFRNEGGDNDEDIEGSEEAAEGSGDITTGTPAHSDVQPAG
tara:strand:+ start:193 stop:579 length:387 start_codon:yes stop_codon:yes gene_type:complete